MPIVLQRKFLKVAKYKKYFQILPHLARNYLTIKTLTGSHFLCHVYGFTYLKPALVWRYVSENKSMQLSQRPTVFPGEDLSKTLTNKLHEPSFRL